MADPSTETAPRLSGMPVSQAVPVVEELVTLEKHLVETGRVRVRTTVEDEPVTLKEQVARQPVEIDRVAIGRPVEHAPEIREEGDVIVIPIVEERLVAVKQLFLVEEVRVRRTTTVAPVEVAASRRVMHAVVERDTASSIIDEEADHER